MQRFFCLPGELQNVWIDLVWYGFQRCPKGLCCCFLCEVGFCFGLNKAYHRVPELVRIGVSSLNVPHTTGRAYIVEDIDILIHAMKNA